VAPAIAVRGSIGGSGGTSIGGRTLSYGGCGGVCAVGDGLGGCNDYGHGWVAESASTVLLVGGEEPVGTILLVESDVCKANDFTSGLGLSWAGVPL
jgi:hypothetical protein